MNLRNMKHKTNLQSTTSLGGILMKCFHPLVVFFVVMWMLLGVYYGDVGYMAQQNSFYTTQAAYMEHLWEQPYGMLWIIGRAMLQCYHYPLWGGALMAALLTLISVMTAYVCRLRGRWVYLQFLPAFLLIYIAFFMGFDLYYQAEAGAIFGVPFCLFVVLLIQSVFIYTFRRKRHHQCTVGESIEHGVVAGVVIAILTCGAVFVSEFYRPYVLATVKMQRLFYEGKWLAVQQVPSDDMMKYSTVAGYFALSRMKDKTDVSQVPIGVLPQSNKPIHLHNKNGNLENGRNYFLMDYLIAAHDNTSAYALGKELIKDEGYTALHLKRMIKVCRAQGLEQEAQEYQVILNLMPFE